MMDVLFWSFYFIMLYFSIFLALTAVDHAKARSQKASMPRNLPTISIIIPAHNEESTIGGVIGSVLALDYPRKNLEIVVVNDGSTDGTRRIAESFKPQGVVVISQKRRGKGGAMNEGLKMARGEFLACLDADSFVEPNTLRKMLTHFITKKVAAVTPVMKVKTPGTFLQKIQWVEYLLSVYMRKLLSYLNVISVTPGPFSIYRTDVLRKLGGFDCKSIVEDQEIAYRLQEKHYQIVQSNEGDVYTFAPRNLKELYYQRKRWFKGSLLTLYQYRNLMFNREYGDFAFYQMPSVLFGLLSCIVVVFFVLQYTVAPLINSLWHMYITNFYISLNPSFSDAVTNFLFSADYSKIFVIWSFSVILVVFLLNSHKETREKLKSWEALPLAAFALVFFIILSFMYFKSLVELILGKEITW